ncbi:ATP-binding cassette sub-family A member 13-like [Terrapene carolina triunguis]|uniref:ATP-binding cassette sub-family A member 13-like n=1 Tax=Terrapene triunguis TaxID=2587831 RepID=UPI000E777997|nr:ATP-binding cassette sub-family A member 13-like [Terrapene carolina triunguis]
MGRSVHQFKALFWKNWLCRLRQPVLSLSEVLWPCILFLILAAIRIQQPSKHQENCYLEARDLPSRGLYPFVQSLFCNVGSRCKNSSYTSQKQHSFRASSFQGGQDSVMGTDLTFLKEIQDFAKGISETSEKAIALQKLWEEESKFSGSTNSSIFLTMDWNETEEMISVVESLHNQPYFWDFLRSLPWLQASSLYKEGGIRATAQFLQTIKNSLASLEDLDAVLSNQSFYKAVKIGLNITITALRFLQDWSLEGSRYNLTLWDVVWDPHAVKVELESRFGLDDLHIGKLLNYTAEFSKIPTEGTLEQFVCSVLSNVSEFKANKEDNEGGCIHAWLEAKVYLVHSVNKIKLYMQIFQQWLSSNEPQKFLFELGRSMADLVSQYPEDSEAWKIISAINILIQHVNEKLEPNFAERHRESQDVTLYLEKLQKLPQWPVMKRLLLIDGAIRNVIIQNLYFTKEIVHNLEKIKPFIKRDGLMHLDIETLVLELKQILMSNMSCTCQDLLTMFEKAVQLPQDLKVRDILAGFLCHHNYPNETFKLSNQIQSVKESVLLLQKVLRGEQSLPDSVMEEYLGWQEIEQQLTENSAAYCKINQLLSTKTLSGEDVYFRSCQEQLLHSLVIHTLEEIWFAFEEDPYWKDLTTFVRRTCEIAQYVNKEEGFTRGHSNDTEASLCFGQKLNLKAIIDSYIAFLQNLTNSPFISWSRILTSVKELLKREKNIQVLEEEESVFILQLAEFIQEMLMPGSSASSSLQDLQSLTEIALNNTIMWLNSSANMKADATDVHIFSELNNELLENYQLLARLWQSEQLEVFWQVVKKVLDQRDHRSPVEATEMLQMFLSKIIISSLQENQKVLNKSLQFFQKILTEWPELSFLDIDYVNNFSEKFIRNLYEDGVLTQEHFTTALSTIHAMRNVSSVLVSNTTSVSKVQDVEKIVSDFYQSIPEVGDSNAASLIQMLFFVYQNIDQLSIQSNNSVLTFFQKISEDISSTPIQHDFQNMSEVFHFLSEAIHLLQGLTQKPLCEKLATVYNYVVLQAQSLAQKGKQEIEVVYSTLGSLKTIFTDTELHTTAFQYLKLLFDVSAESLLNNECADWYTPSIPSVRQTGDVHNSLVLPLVRVLSNTSNFKSEVNVPFAMHCTATWLQMWTEILEEMSEILRLDLNFFSYLRNGLNHLSEDLENLTHAEMCNTTFTVNPETTSAIHLLKIITEAYNLNEWKDFETLSGLISKLSNVIDALSSIKKESLEEAFQTMENVTVKLQKSLLKVNVSREFLDSWFDVFLPLSSKVEYRDTHVDFIGHSLSDILTLSTEEFGTVLTDLRETAGFLKNISRDQDLLSCVMIFQNVTKFVLEDILKEKNVSQISVLSHLNPLLTSDNIVNVLEGCNRWMHIISSLNEKYITYSHLENAKRVLFFLTSLGSINETDTSLKNTLDIVNMTFNLIEPPCLLNGSDAHCADVYFSILAKILKFLPMFSEKDDGQTRDFIFTLLNASRSQIRSIVKDLMRFSPYTSDSEQMYFIKLITGAIKNSSEVPNLPQSLQPPSVALLRRIQIFLKNITSETLQNSSSLLDTVNLLNAFEALPQDKIMSFLKKSFQHLISYFMSNLPHNMQSLQNITLHTWMKAADLNVELVRKALNILKSHNLTNFPIRSDDKGFPKHMATLVKNIENADLEFLIDQLKQVSKSLHHFFKNIKTVYIENFVLDKLTGWVDSFENNSYSWNLTNLWQITQLFKETELDDILQVLYILPDGVSLIQRLAHKNITDALIEVYTFTSTQEANMSICTKEDLSNKVDSLLELLEVVTDMPEESARALGCLTAVICWNLTTATPQNDPALRTCNLNAHTNFSSIYNTIADILEQFKLTTPGGHDLCSNEDYLREITYKVTCFFHQFKEWNSILLKLSEIHNINSLALKQLLGFWNKLSVYVMAFGNSSTISVYCSSTPKRQAALQLIETLNNMTSTEMAMAKAIFEQLADLYHALKLDRSTGMSVPKTLLTHLKSMANEISGVLDNEDVLSFLSAVQPLLTLSPVGNQTYMVLMALSALSRNSSLIGNFEALWLDTERGIQDLLVNFSVPNLLSVIDKEVQLLSAAARKNSSLALASLLKQFNSSSLETLLRSFEDFQEVARDWLHKYTNKNFSRIINALVVLMANEKSSDDIVLIIKGIIEFLELFTNGSKEDHIDISFVADLLSGEKLNNVHVAHVILQNSLLNMLSDLTTKEEVLDLNATDLQLMDFIDLFFDDAQYENYGKEIASFQSRTMEMIKEFLQIIFSSSGGHYSNKMFVLLKNLHKDIIAEMRIFTKDDIGTLLNLDQSVNLKEEVDGLKENMYDLIKDAAISENGTLHFDNVKGLKFMRDLFNVLFKDFSVKNGSRSNYETFTFVNHVLFNTSNSGDLAQLIRDLSRTLQFMRQTSAEVGNLMNFFNNHFKDFLVSYPTFREMVLANLTELLASVDRVFPLKNRQIIETTETLLDLLLWISGANYTPSPFPELAVDLRSLLWESNEIVKLAKIVEAIVKFLTLSKKASEKVANILEPSINSNATENLDYIEVVYSDLQRAVHDAIEELTETETADVLRSNHHQVADLGKAFLDLTYLSIRDKLSRSCGSGTANISTRLLTNLSKLNDLNDIAGEIAKFLTNVQNYSAELERLTAIVTRGSINSSDDTASLIEDLLDFFVPINDIISKIHLTSRLNFTHDPINEEKWEGIQEMITYLCKGNITGIKASFRAVADLFLGAFWKNYLNENDLNLLLTYADNQDDFLKVLEVTMESFKLMKNISGGSFNLWSLFASLINQNITYQQKEQSIWETIIEDSLNRTNPWIELLHLSADQQVNSTRDLLQTVMGFFANGTSGTDDMAQLENSILRMMHDFDLIFKPLSSYEKYARQLVNLAEYWRQGPLKEQRFSEMCQGFQKQLSAANARLLQKVQIMALSVFTILSDNPTVISNLLCAFTSCKDGLTRHFLLSAIEGINLVHEQYQDIETMWSASNEGDCGNLLYVNRKLSSALESFQRALENITYSSCECQITLENIQKHMQMMSGNLEAPLSENLVIAFVSNFSLPNDVKIKDCMQNVPELARELRSLVNISEDTINTLLEANFSQSKFLYSALAVALAGRCDKEVLSLLLTLPENGKTSLAVQELCSLPALDLYIVIVQITQNLNLRNIIYKIMIPSEVNKVLNALLEVVISISSLLKKGQHVLENLPMFLQTFKSVDLLDISAFQQFLQGGKSRSSIAGSLQSLIRAVCKEESSFFSNTNMFIDMPKITELLEDDMAKYSIPEDSTPFCLQLYQEILQSPNGALMWTFLKPLLHGKILYTPNSEKFNMVIEKANHTFGFVDNLKIYSEAWLRMSGVFKSSENFLMVNQLQEALQNSFIKNFIESRLNIDVGNLIGKLQEYEPMMEKMLNNSVTEQINLLAQLMVNISSCVLLDRFQHLESVEKLEAKAQELMQQNNFLASIIFNTSSKRRRREDSASHPPQHISYTIRTSVLYSMRTDLLKNPMWKSHPQNLPGDGFKYNHIFVPLQDMIERAIIAVHAGADASEPEIQVQAMPYPCHTSDLFLNNIGFFFPLIMMLAWMVSVAGMVRKLVYEREIHLEEYMKTMGVNPAIHFLAWFLENVIVLTISSCALVIILKVSGIFVYSDGFLVFLFLLDFGVAVVMLSYLLGAFFSSANTAALCASLIYVISFLPYIVLLVLENQLSFALQIITCFLSTAAFGQGVFFITFFENQEIGIQWSNMYQPLAQGGSMTFGWACWMIFFDSILYLLAGWYFSNVIPGRLGFRKPWYFPFTISYWKKLCGTEKRRKHLNSNMLFVNEGFAFKALFFIYTGSLPANERSVSEGGSPIGVILMSLTKEYTDNKKTAVKDLSLTFYKGQITALLGANGAGKTTIISMLTGLYPPSSGTIIINGRDIHTDLAAIRMEMGVCPQYDVLFDTLTVREHLLFYGSVKAPLWTKKQLHHQVSRALEDVDLSHHQFKHVGALSGGMKRRLSIAISFIGNSKTVVLDEPTSGVDPCSRRRIWDILLKYRADCTLIFTTHHLDEAEVLSDRIAILQHGQLRCCGPPSYLKETYGQGYSLTIIKKPSAFEIQDPEYISRVTSLIQFYVPEAFLKENSGSELTIAIPAKADKSSFKGLFQAMDENLERLHVTGYGISDTTLEEVFLKLLQDTEQMPQVPLAEELGLSHINSCESTYQNCNSLLDAQSVRGTRLVFTQIAALLMKRFHHTRRDWRGTLSNVLLPVLFVAMAMALFTVKPLATDYPSLKLMPGLYDNVESSFFSTESDDLGNLSYVLLRHFSGQDHPCTYSRQDVKNDSCWQTEPSPPQEFLDACGCVTDHRKCPSFNVSAAYLKNRKGHVLYNLSGFNVEEYLIMPTNKARYGGWSFGVKTSPELQDLNLNKTYSKPLAKVWYSQKGFHSLPSSLNQLNNLILWMNLPPSVDWRQYGITLYSHPYGGAMLDKDKIMENVRQCGVALCIMLGFSILTASIGSSVVKDRVSGTKRLQHISGLGYKTYWLANFLYDMLFYLVPVGLCISVIAAFQLSAFTFRENLAATALLLILFGYATLPWMYLMSRFFSSSDIAFISYISLNFVFGLCTMLVTLLPHLLATVSKAQNLQNIYNILKWAFIVFPPFCLGQGLLELSYNQIKFDLTSSFGIDSYVSPFEMNFLGWIFVAMALQGTVILLLRVLLHWDLLQKLRSHCSISSTVNPSEDEDVEVERKRLFGGRTQNDILLLYNLRKCYQGFSKRNTAVKDISLGIPRGECFGLLGANGAGKSTTFKMLTGDITPSGGRAVIRTPTGSEMDIFSASSEGILIGYCPQQDALDELLTGWEHLYYYCSLRGVPKQCIHKVAGDLVSRLHLDAHINKLVKAYSGGTKRKLSTALALVGKPQILLLDEPSSGMDPCSKRYLWKAIMKEVQDGCAAVLTSHSMEECEALCTRLAIMVDGGFRCLGSPQHIKNRFGDGYSVKVWLNKETSNHGAILDYLQLHFPGTQFKEQRLNLQEYRVPYRWGCLPELFKVLENHKVLLQIKHYSISETTLEQVFINFATQQQETPSSAQESATNHHHHLPV